MLCMISTTGTSDDAVQWTRLSKTWVISSVSVGCRMIARTASTSRVFMLRKYPTSDIHAMNITPHLGYSCYEHNPTSRLFMLWAYLHIYGIHVTNIPPHLWHSCYEHTPTLMAFMLWTYPHVYIICIFNIPPYLQYSCYEYTTIYIVLMLRTCLQDHSINVTSFLI
jgi:hypothetical protein